MNRLLLKFALISVAAFAYIAAPFVTAWSIREAVRNGDSAYLERAIDWPVIRETLKPTLSRIALDLPDPSVETAAKPGLWTRFKAYWAQGAVNRAIDSYITPEGLPQLFSMRKAYRDYMGIPDEAKTMPIFERIRRAWSRVKRAEFTSLTSFEVDMADKLDENRIYLGRLELTGVGWILKELRIKFLTTADGTQQPLLTTPKSMRGAWSTGFIARAEAAPAPADRTSFWRRAKSAAR